MFEESVAHSGPGRSNDWAAVGTAPANATSLSALITVDCSSLSGAALVDAIQAAEKALSLLTGIQMRLLAALAKPFVAGDPMRLAARLARKNCITGDDTPANVEMFVADAAASLASAEVAAVLRISPVTAGIRVREADTMTTVLLPTLEALEHGTLDRGKARVIAEHCAPLAPEHSAMVQKLVLGRAGRTTTSELREITGQAVITVDPQGSEERHKAAAARRDLAMTALPDAMATLKAFLPAEGAVKIFQISDLLATATAGIYGDARGIGARRVDALVDIADHLLTHGHLDLSHYLGNPLPDHGTHLPDHAAQLPDHGADLPDHAADLPDHAAGRTPDAENDDSEQRPASGSAVCVSKVPGLIQAPIASISGDTRASGISEHTTLNAPPAAPIDRSKSTARRTMTRQGRRPHLSVIIGLETLAGLNDLPGRLAGFGAITAGVARSIAASAATITAALADSGTGSVTEVGTLTYRPRQDLRDHIAALHTKCQFPSCRQPVWRCDIDHREPFDHHDPHNGGATTMENTAPFCRRHHLFKHHTEWQVRPDPSAYTLSWVSPTGHCYSKAKDQVVAPELWVTTAGGLAAQQLDTIVATQEVTPEVREGQVSVEEMLATLLLRHHLNRRSMEYEPHADPWTLEGWDDDLVRGALPITDPIENNDDAPPF
ncbi:DUF222 domain-containing protein [Nakamurella sp. GG22]